MNVQRLVAAALGMSLIATRAFAGDAAPPLQTSRTQQTPLADTVVVVAPPAALPERQPTYVQPVVLESESTYRPSTAFVVGGLVTFGLAYSAAAVTGAVKQDHCGVANANTSICRTETWPLYIPLAGPFIQIGTVQGTDKNTITALLVIDGVVQVAGVAMFIYGLAHRSELVRYSEEKPRLQLAPFAFTNTAGLVAVGTF